MTARHLLGLDIGGSKTHALLVADGEVVLDLVVGSANIASVGSAAARAALDEIVAAVPDGVTVAAVCAGAAGADNEAGRSRMVALLRGRFPGAEVEVVHDTRIILAAAGLEVGSVVISGTGSAAWGIDAAGREARAGGWGYLLGDEGGGYAVTRDALRRALTDRDEGRPASTLTRALLEATGAKDPLDLLDRFYQQPERRFWACQARGVIAAAEGGDPTADAIVADAARSLAALASLVSTHLAAPGPVVLAGGLAVNHPQLTDRVSILLTEQGITDVRVLDRDPAWGAVGLAHRLTEENNR